MRLALHPEGLAPRILNFAEWRAHLLDVLERELAATADPALESLLAELHAYPGAPGPAPRREHDLFVPLEIRGPEGEELRFFSTTATFGTAVDVTVAELSIESFFPADAATRAAVAAALPPR